jgi:hypothetical protein
MPKVNKRKQHYTRHLSPSPTSDGNSPLAPACGANCLAGALSWSTQSPRVLRDCTREKLILFEDFILRHTTTIWRVLVHSSSHVTQNMDKGRI